MLAQNVTKNDIQNTEVNREKMGCYDEMTLIIDDVTVTRKPVLNRTGAEDWLKEILSKEKSTFMDRLLFVHSGAWRFFKPADWDTTHKTKGGNPKPYTFTIFREQEDLNTAAWRKVDKFVELFVICDPNQNFKGNIQWRFSRDHLAMGTMEYLADKYTDVEHLREAMKLLRDNGAFDGGVKGQLKRVKELINGNSDNGNSDNGKGNKDNKGTSGKGNKDNKGNKNNKGSQPEQGGNSNPVIPEGYQLVPENHGVIEYSVQGIIEIYNRLSEEDKDMVKTYFVNLK